MTTILNIIFALLSMFPPPITALIGLVIFIAILSTLLKLIKLILDAIPFV